MLLVNALYDISFFLDSGGPEAFSYVGFGLPRNDKHLTDFHIQLEHCISQKETTRRAYFFSMLLSHYTRAGSRMCDSVVQMYHCSL